MSQFFEYSYQYRATRTLKALKAAFPEYGFQLVLMANWRYRIAVLRKQDDNQWKLCAYAAKCPLKLIGRGIT